VVSENQNIFSKGAGQVFADLPVRQICRAGKRSVTRRFGGCSGAEMADYASLIRPAACFLVST
jgi:hypothetical protein